MSGQIAPEIPGHLPPQFTASRWGAAFYVTGTGKYEDQIWFTGSPEEVFDLVCGLYVANADA